MHIVRSQNGRPTPHSTSAGTSRSSNSHAGDLDTAKVDRVCAAISAGSYNVDPDRIASRMMASARACAAVGLPGPAAAGKR